MSAAPANKFRTWFGTVWKGRWEGIADEYAAIRDKKGLLADIAARGGIFSTRFIANPREAAFMEGRRALALEILELAQIDPQRLRSLIETPMERTGK